MTFEEYFGLSVLEMLDIWFWRLLICLCSIISGVIGLATLGLFIPKLTYWASGKLARFRFVVKQRRDYD